MAELDKPEFRQHDVRWLAAVTVGVVAAIFTLIVCVVLIGNYVLLKSNEPLDNPELVKLREQLAESTGENQALVEQIRAMDMLARKAFFSSQAQLNTGGLLLLAGAVVLVIAFKLSVLWKPELPSPGATEDAEGMWLAKGQARHLVGATAVLLVAFSLLAAYMSRSEMTKIGVMEEETPWVPPTWEEMQVNWPTFRGPGGYGVAHFTNAPVDWDGETGRNILWTAEVPLPGFSSPVIWGDRLYISGATEEVREVYCYNADTGELLWRRTVPTLRGSTGEVPNPMEDTGFAAPSMVAHRDRVCAIFANGDFVCYSNRGSRLWGMNLGLPEDHYGHASSLIAYEHLVYVQYDQTSDARLMAFDIRDGSRVWTVEREKISWASPALLPTPDGIQLVLTSEEDVDGYDPITGSLLWTVDCLAGEVCQSAAYGGGLVHVVSDMSAAQAIKVSKTDTGFVPEVLWEWDDSLPDIASPVATDQHVYLAMSFAEIACLDALTGEEMWLEDFDEGFSSSPMLVGDRIYATDIEGMTTIFKTGPTFEVIGSPKLGEPVVTTPAFLDGRMYVRAFGKLICIEDKDE